MNKETWVFLKAVLHNPRHMGAALPSSRSLAREMAVHVPVKSSKIIVELGAGTGVITEALLKRGIKPDHLIVIENSLELAQKLKDRFPNVRIIRGNAVNLIELLGKKAQVSVVISSLPLLSLPKRTSNKILSQITSVLPKGGRYIQYTYSFSENKFKLLKQLKKISSKRVWTNIPPARVDVYVNHR